MKNYNEMHCTWVDATSTFFPPLACFPALCALGTGWPSASFPALSTSYLFSRAWYLTFVLGSENNSYTYKLHLSKFYYLTSGDLLQVFPPFQPVTFFPAWHYALFTHYKPISDQSNVFQVTENGLQIFVICQC